MVKSPAWPGPVRGWKAGHLPPFHGCCQEGGGVSRARGVRAALGSRAAECPGRRECRGFGGRASACMRAARGARLGQLQVSEVGVLGTCRRPRCRPALCCVCVWRGHQQSSCFHLYVSSFLNVWMTPRKVHVCAGGVLMESDACHLCHHNPPTGPRPRVGLCFLKLRDRVAGSTCSSPALLTAPGSALTVRVR